MADDLTSSQNEAWSAEQIKDFRTVFSMFDTNRDGTICCKELAAVFKALGKNMSEHECKVMISTADRNDDGVLSFSEFLNIMSISSRAEQEDAQLLSAFKQYDADNDGYITPAELRGAMLAVGEALTPDEVTQMINAADRDGDGRVDYAEFLDLMKS